VTEEITGVDIVCEQIKVAGGLTLGIRQKDIGFTGHAIECRINAERPFESVPSAGTVTGWDVPSGEGIRMDSHMRAGAIVPSYYDSLIGKLIVRADDRPQCIARLKVALGRLRVDGVSTNSELHQVVLDDADFVRGGVDIHFLEKLLRRRATEMTERRP
jgi:acetyl-CoA carboxylase biotin carboxylase subunit